MGYQLRDTAVMRSVPALRQADGDPPAATLALAPVMVGSVPAGHRIWLVEALLLEAYLREPLLVLTGRRPVAVAPSGHLTICCRGPDG